MRYFLLLLSIRLFRDLSRVFDASGVVSRQNQDSERVHDENETEEAEWVDENRCAEPYAHTTQDVLTDALIASRSFDAVAGESAARPRISRLTRERLSRTTRFVKAQKAYRLSNCKRTIQWKP